jgi:hypothetical protein
MMMRETFEPKNTNLTKLFFFLYIVVVIVVYFALCTNVCTLEVVSLCFIANARLE